MSRILWVSYPSQGEYFPVVPLAGEMQARGHSVVMSNDPATETVLRSFGFDFLPGRMPGAQFELVPASYREHTLERMEDIGGRLRDQHFDLVVVDCLAHGAQLAAEAVEVPWVSLVHYGIDETAGTIDHRLRLTLDGDHGNSQVYREWWESIRAEVGLDPDPRPKGESRWHTFSSLLTLVVGLPELALHPYAPLPAYVSRIGPVHWDPPVGAAPDWLEDVGKDKRAVLITNSTARQDDLGVVLKAAEGLAGAGLQVVATIAADHEVPDLGPDVILARFVPHSAVIPRVKAVVCSAGLGVTTKAVCAGVPVVAVPSGRDQYVVAAAVERARVGIAISADQTTSGNLAEAVLRLLSEPEFAERASTLSIAAQRYRPAARAADLVEQALGSGNS